MFPWHFVGPDALNEMIKSAIAWEKANPSVTFTGLGSDYYQDELRTIVGLHDLAQNMVAYLVSGLSAMLALRFGEKQLFARQANVNWKLALPMWIVPIGYLASAISEYPGEEFRFILITNWAMIGFLGLYAFAYHAIGAYKSWKNSPTILA